MVHNCKYSQTIYEEKLRDNVSKKDIWLDIGCGANLLPQWRKKEEIELCLTPKLIAGIDCYYPTLKKNKSLKNLVNGNIDCMPFKDNTFTIITGNMVFEHLQRPEVQLQEILRILKHEGKLIFHTPNIFSYILCR